MQALGLVALLSLLAGCLSASDALAARGVIPAFPEADGYGAESLGARGCHGRPKVLVVDSLRDDESDGCGSHSCTFREAMVTEGPRFISFNVTGIVVLDAKKKFVVPASASCVTVTGATAPGSGVTIANGTLSFEKGFHDGIMRHVRWRPGIWPDQRGTTSGCNGWEWRCDGDVKEPCRDASDIGSCRGLRPATCSEHQVGEWKRGCGICDIFKQRGRDPDDWSQCNDTVLNGAEMLDAVHIPEGVMHLILDHMSLTWASDECVAISANRVAGKVSITNSIVGAGNTSHDGTSGKIFPGHREKGHNMGIFFGGIYGEPGESTSVRDWSFYRNLILDTRQRAPLHSSGSAEYVNNIFFNNTGSADVAPWKNTLPMQLDFRENLFREGPDRNRGQRQGYCVGGTDADRACWQGSNCQSGVCDARHSGFFSLGSNILEAASLFITGNRFENLARTDITRLPSREFDDDWDRVGVGLQRPLRREEVDSGRCSNDPRRACARNEDCGPGRCDRSRSWSAYANRRDRPQEPRPRYDVTPLAPSDLPASLLPHVGASRPVRDVVDQDLVASWERRRRWRGPLRTCRGGGHSGRGCSSGAICGPDGACVPGFTYPVHTGSPWADSDGDGMDDAWEAIHFEGLSRGPLDDSDGDGYYDIEEWMNGTDPQQPEPSSGAGAPAG